MDSRIRRNDGLEDDGFKTVVAAEAANYTAYA
jgi:hypothetical protein